MSDQVEHWERLSSHPPDASVLDPRDVRGHKNRYIAYVRNRSVRAALDVNGVEDPILDFGCGTGSLSAAIDASGRRMLGVDISMALLRRTRDRRWTRDPLFVHYDGQRLPLMDQVVAGACTYVVLNHILEDSMLAAVLGEIRRVLQPGGVMVAIEQVRTRRTLDHAVWQCRRTIGEFANLFASAGFQVQSAQVIRYGRFPTTPLIRMGLIPQVAFGPVQWLEAAVGRLAGPIPWDYADTCFVLKKPT